MVASKAIIIGYGRAGRIHRSCYDRMAHVQVVCVVEPDREKWDQSEAILWFEELQQITALSANEDEYIVDICVPTALHLDVLRDARSAGFSRIIVEKPLNDGITCVKKPDDVWLCEQYVVSPVILEIISWIDKYQLRPVGLDLNFSKDRRQDSLARRGMVAGETSMNALLIEIPHTLALARLVLGPIEKVASSRIWDMVVKESHIGGLGGGEVVCRHRGTAWSVLASDLQARQTIRAGKLTCEAGWRIEMEFGVAPSYIGRCQLFEGNRMVCAWRGQDEALLRLLMMATMARGGARDPYHEIHMDVSRAISEAVRSAGEKEGLEVSQGLE